MKRIYHNNSTIIKYVPFFITTMKEYDDSEFKFYDFDLSIIEEKYSKYNYNPFFATKFGNDYTAKRNWIYNYLIGPFTYTDPDTHKTHSIIEPFNNIKDSYWGRYLKGVPYYTYIKSMPRIVQSVIFEGVIDGEDELKEDHFDKYTRDPRNWNSLTGIGDETHNEAFNMGFEPIYARIRTSVLFPDKLQTILSNNVIKYKDTNISRNKTLTTIYPTKVNYDRRLDKPFNNYSLVVLTRYTINGWYWDYDVIHHDLPVPWEEHKWSRKKKYYYYKEFINRLIYKSTDWDVSINEIPNTATDNIPAEYNIWP